MYYYVLFIRPSMNVFCRRQKLLSNKTKIWNYYKKGIASVLIYFFIYLRTPFGPNPTSCHHVLPNAKKESSNLCKIIPDMFMVVLCYGLYRLSIALYLHCRLLTEFYINIRLVLINDGKKNVPRIMP